MAAHDFISEDFTSVPFDVVVATCGKEIPAHRAILEKLSPDIEAALMDVSMHEDSDMADLVSGLLGDFTESGSKPATILVLPLQSTSEDGVRLLLAHGYGHEIGMRFCQRTASEVALIAKKYDIPVLFHKADAFLAKNIDDRTTDRLRCKPQFWATTKDGVTDSALKFLVFAENTGLGLMKAAVVNFLAHLLVLDSSLDLSRHCLASQANQTTWQSVAKRAAALQTTSQQLPAAARLATPSSPTSPVSPFSPLSRSSSNTSSASNSCSSSSGTNSPVHFQRPGQSPSSMSSQASQAAFCGPAQARQALPPQQMYAHAALQQQQMQQQQMQQAWAAAAAQQMYGGGAAWVPGYQGFCQLPGYGYPQGPVMGAPPRGHLMRPYPSRAVRA